MLPTAARILFFSSSRVLARLVYAKDLKYPQKVITSGMATENCLQRVETSREVFVQENHWRSCRGRHDSILFEPCIPHSISSSFGRKNYSIIWAATVTVRLRSNCNFPIVLFKNAWVSNANSEQCTPNSPKLFIQGLLIKFSWVRAIPISHVLFIHASWQRKMCLVVEDHKSVTR